MSEHRGNNFPADGGFISPEASRAIQQALEGRECVQPPPGSHSVKIEFSNVSPELFDLITGQSEIDRLVTEATRKMLEAEEKIAIAAAAIGMGYVCVEEFDGAAMNYRRHFLISPRVPPMERYEFPSWYAFDQWRDRQ